MFYTVEKFNNKRTGSHIRQVLYVGIAVAAVALIILGVSYSAFAVQNNDMLKTRSAMAANLDADQSAPIHIVEEINLGNQGVFPADHILATVHVDGEVFTVDTFGKSDETLLEMYGFTLENQDYTKRVENEFGYDLYVNRMTVSTTTDNVTVPYDTIRVEDKTMMAGEEVVTTEGQDGFQVDTYEVRTLNGETSTELVSTEVIREKIDQVITYGTKVDHSKPTGFKNNGSHLNLTSVTITSVDEVNKTFTLSNGEEHSYSKVVNCKAYAYSEPGGITAMGTPTRQGAIAVDPRVIPLGSRVFVITDDGSVVYGFAVAQDTGGDIKGNTVDLHYNSNDTCRAFGVRRANIYVLD